jgi:hypothetical protein
MLKIVAFFLALLYKGEVAKLGDNNYAKREMAQVRLTRLSFLAVPALEKFGYTSDDQEIKRRSAEILDAALETGINEEDLKYAKISELYVSDGEPVSLAHNPYILWMIPILEERRLAYFNALQTKYNIPPMIPTTTWLPNPPKVQDYTYVYANIATSSQLVYMDFRRLGVPVKVLQEWPKFQKSQYGSRMSAEYERYKNGYSPEHDSEYNDESGFRFVPQRLKGLFNKR